MKVIELEVFKNDPTKDRNQLLKLRNHSLLGTDQEVVYIYSLISEQGIHYPKAVGRVIYIGEACRVGVATTGTRFSQHVSKGSFTGGDTGNNFVISQYYHAGWRLKLRIFTIPRGTTRKDFEAHLILSHMGYYGAPPIGQNKIPKNGATTTALYKFINENKRKYTLYLSVLKND